MEIPRTQKCVVLASRPRGLPKATDLRFQADVPAPQPSSEKCVVRNLFLSLDPGLRASMDENVPRVYSDPMKLGAPVRGLTVGEVVHSCTDRISVGDLVVGGGGWQEYYAARPRDLQRVGRDELGTLSPSAALGVVGVTGLTAYFGLLRVGRPKAGETVLVSTAAGATGSVVAQIAKHVVGCRVVGIAGGAEKCALLKRELGLDGVIDYKAGDVNAAIRRECPKGVDVYFDNVGGEILNAAMRRMRPFGRIVACGAISNYNGEVGTPTPSKVLTGVVTSRLRMEGFIVNDFVKDWRQARSDLAKWVREGKVRSLETVVEGLQGAPAAFQGLFEGKNSGKMVVKVSGPAARL
eukprot:TRINITY_DN43584_c0_g1_i1.p2 TRINITY_DN43584_c0_g1~~TRINITY_DN43584_c0_g1_i1.p2  ORF type:complete len:368 (+),score=127.14 TRINITY_DN43584_c0_g1_i1:52-1104(+)